MNARRILILAPHTDDAELGCGGTTARVVGEGHEVFAAAYSIAEESLPDGVPETQLFEEFRISMARLGVPEDHTFVRRFPVRRFSEHRQDILDDLIRLRETVNPDVIFVPSTHDIHQDHAVVSEEAVRAFKHRTVWGYELPWNNLNTDLSGFVTLKAEHIDAKWNALEAYATQITLRRAYFTRELVFSLAAVRGVQAGVEYAEAFEVIRHVVSNSGLTFA
jgi:LmbE family N-acetylglucosaminyl deacetylase